MNTLDEKQIKIRKDNTKHNYAPCIVPNQGTTQTTKLFNERANNTTKIFQEKMKLTEDLRTEAITKLQEHCNIGSRRNNQEQYLKRMETKKSQYKELVKVPENLSPLLDLSKMNEMTIENRIYEYNRRHKCPHFTRVHLHYDENGKAIHDKFEESKTRRTFTDFVLHQSEKLDGTKEDVYITPTCHCETERVTEKYCTKDKRCGHCTNIALHEVHDNTFPGEIYICKFCKMQWYRIIGWTRIRPQGIITAKEAPKLLISTKTWNIDQNQCVSHILPQQEQPLKISEDSYWCRICRINSTNKAEYAIHLGSKAHIQKQVDDQDVTSFMKEHLDDDDFNDWKSPEEKKSDNDQKWEIATKVFVPRPSNFRKELRNELKPTCDVLHIANFESGIEKQKEESFEYANPFDEEETSDDEIRANKAAKFFNVKKESQKESVRINLTPQASIYDSITGFIKKILGSLHDMCNRLKELILNKIRNFTIKKVISKVWDAILECFNVITEALLENPVGYVYSVYRLLFSDSHTERLLILATFLANQKWNNAVNRFFHLIGWDTRGYSVFASRRIHDKKQTRYLREDQAAAAEENKQSVAEVNSQSVFTRVKNLNKQKEKDVAVFEASTPTAKQEQGSLSTILEYLFAFKEWLPTKTAMEFLKNFNTVMTGWKNLHELILNFLSFLPTWITKLFTITDPRKRYGVEAKTKGNPVYDMMQAYTSLVSGMNCASPKSYEQFQIAWRAADEYIMKDFPPCEQVYRLHKHFYANANSIMKPGTKGSKPIPFAITLFGPPGTGKSTSWPLLLSGIVPGRIEDIIDMSYTRNTGSSYFDGYNPERHKIFVYDDFAHKIDDTCVEEFMAMMTSGDYLPPYASINDPNVGMKGTSFASPIIVLASNFQDFSHCKQIADKVALARRLGIIITWDKRFVVGNTYKVDRATPDGNTEPINKPLTHDNFYTVPELQVLLSRLYLEHFQEQDNVNDSLNTHLSPTPKYNFMDKYNNVRAKTPQAKQQYGWAWTCGYLAVLNAAYKLADYEDEHCGYIVKSLTCLGVTLAVCVLTYKMLGLDVGETTEYESGENQTQKAAQPRPFVRAALQSGSQNDEGLIRKFMRNHVKLVNEDNKFVNGIFVCGRVLLTVKHFIEISKSLMITTHRSQDPLIYDIELSDCKVVQFKDADLCLVEMPTHIQPYTDLISSIAPEAHTKNCKAYVSRRMDNGSLMTYEVDMIPGQMRCQVNANGKISYETSDITYHFKHRNGDCGNILMVEQGGSLKIIGMHNLGLDMDEEMSLAVMLNRGEINHYLSQLSVMARISRDGEFPHESATYEDGEMVGLNKTQYLFSSREHIMPPSKTTLQPSLIFDKVQEHIMEPALLSKKGELDPMVRALGKYGLSTKQFPAEWTNQAVDSLTEQLLSFKTKDDMCRELTLHECLNGIEGKVESVDLSTSSGYPFSLDPSTRGAMRKVINGEPGQLVLGPKAQAHYDSWEQLLAAGSIPSDPFLATLKDEKRKKEKVLLGKTRIFCAGSLTGFMHCKRLFGAFNLFLKRIRPFTFSTLGINRASIEWHQMIMWFREVGIHGFDGDQEEWDGRLKAGIVIALVKLINEFYNDGNDEKRLILILHAIFPLLRITWWVDGKLLTFILEIAGCMPSGWFLTFVMNSLVNAVLMRICWIALVSKPFNDLKYFRDYVREKYAGDDNLMAVADQFLIEYNAISISEFLKEYDQIYTPALKTGNIVAYQKLVDCSFLKTKTSILYSRYVPIFDYEQCLETSNWIRKTDDPFKATEDNCNDVLRNIFFYGQDTFEKVRGKMLEASSGMNLISYHSLRDAFLQYGSIPDPHGSYSFSKNSAKPDQFYKLVQMAKDQSECPSGQKEIGSPKNMSTPGTKLSGTTVEQKEAVTAAAPAASEGKTATIDTAEPQVTTKEGVHLTEQQETVKKVAVDGDSRDNLSRAAAHLNEPSWDIKSMLHRQNLVGVFSWKLTDTIGSVIPITGSADYPKMCDVPADLLQNEIVSTPFMRFQYWRCKKVVVRFQLTASRFHQGRLLISYVPSCIPKSAIEDTPRTATYWTQLQYAQLDPANGTVIDFEIPFRFHKGWVDLVFGDSLGQLRVQVTNQLQVATGGSTEVDVKVFVSFEDAEFRVPRPGGSSFRSLLRQLHEDGYELVKKEKLVKASFEMGFFDDAVSGLEDIVESIVPHDILGLAAEICLDKPTFTEFPPPIVRKDAQYMACNRGVENLEKMTLEPSTLYITDDQFGDKIDEMDMKYLLKKKQLLDTVSWHSTDVVGTILWSNIISPTHLMNPAPAGEPFDITILAFLASIFTYWRGSIDLIFQIVGTGFHEGRLGFCNHPGTTTVSTDYKTGMSQYVNSQTIRNTNNTVEVRIPFLSDTPWKRCWNGEPLSDNDQDHMFRAMDFVSGCFTLRVDVPLKNPNNVANNVDINIFLCAGDDFEFSFLSITGGSIIPYTAVKSKRREEKRKMESQRKLMGSTTTQVTRELFKATYQAGEESAKKSPKVDISKDKKETDKKETAKKLPMADVNKDLKNDKNFITLARGPATTFDKKIKHFGETYKNLREMCKRYQTIANKQMTIVGPGSTCGNFIFEGPDFGGLLGMMFRCYRFFRGPMNYKFELKLASSVPTNTADTFITGFLTANVQQALAPISSISTIGSVLGFVPGPMVHPGLVRFSTQQVAEFAIPFGSIYHSLLNSNDYDNLTTYFQNSLFFQEIDFDIINPYIDTKSGYIFLSVAFGDETRLGLWTGIPLMTFDKKPAYPNPGFIHRSGWNKPKFTDKLY